MEIVWVVLDRDNQGFSEAYGNETSAIYRARELRARKRSIVVHRLNVRPFASTEHDDDENREVALTDRDFESLASLLRHTGDYVFCATQEIADDFEAFLMRTFVLSDNDVYVETCGDEDSPQYVVHVDKRPVRRLGELAFCKVCGTRKVMRYPGGDPENGPAFAQCPHGPHNA